MSPDLPTSRPPRGGLVLSWFGRAFLWLRGWQVEGGLPPFAKVVVVAAPHTSNWDGVYMLMIAWALRLRLSWMVKDSLVRWPFRRLMRWTGAVPVDRSRRGDTVQQLRRTFDEADQLWLAIAPSGTRAHRDHWKSGFYRIAQAAGVPLLLGFLDYSRKRGGLEQVLWTTGDVHADMEAIRAFYQGMRGLRPELQSEIRLRSEDE